jgi:NAD(P)-dependent dehydrogenase (short-subunit alcohol dehydrogenase family)
VRAAGANVVSGAAFLFSSTVSLAIGSVLAGGGHEVGAPSSAPASRVVARGTREDVVRPNPPEAQAVMTSIQLMPRMGDPDEMVGPALRLTSDAGSFITGHVIFADGGMVPR